MGFASRDHFLPEIYGFIAENAFIDAGKKFDPRVSNPRSVRSIKGFPNGVMEESEIKPVDRRASPFNCMIRKI